jgi:hypothetical protein
MDTTCFIEFHQLRFRVPEFVQSGSGKKSPAPLELFGFLCRHPTKVPGHGSPDHQMDKL